MKRYLISICTFFVSYGAIAEVFVPGGDYSALTSFDGYYEDNSVVHVVNGVDISANNNTIVLDRMTYLYNNGTIYGNIDINGKNLMVYNTGTIGGIVNSSEDSAIVTQVIQSADNINNINANVDNFSILVSNFDGLNFNSIKDMPSTSFKIENSSVIIDDFTSWQNWDKGSVVLDGDVLFIIKHADTVTSGQVVRFTSDETPIRVEIEDLDNMYKVERRYENGGIALYIVRNTNYEDVFGNDGDVPIAENTALETIRARHPDDKFLMALDAAQNLDELNTLKGRSYRFNHALLLNPVKTMSKVALNNFITDEDIAGVGITPYYILSNDLVNVGGRVYAGYDFDDLYFKLGLSLNRFNYSNDLNEFSGMSYGLDIKSKQYFDKFWLSEIIGLSLTDFTADYICKDGSVKDNPSAWSWYGDVSMGYDFEVVQDVFLSPIVGITYMPYKVADVSETESYLHGGADVKYSFVVDGIKYEYGLSLAAGTNADIFANAKVGFVSVTDNAGISLDMGVLKDEFDYNYRFSLNAKLLF